MSAYPLILDCDTGEDDAIAIVLAVLSKLPLKYIVTCHGNTSIDNATRNSSNILSLLDAADVKVIRGAAKPLEPHKLEGENFTVGTDFIGNNGICDVEIPASKHENILDFGDDTYIAELADRIKKEGPVDYIITGPCTNFARLCMHMGEDIKKYIHSLTIMGGAVYVRGTRGAGVRNIQHDRDASTESKSWAEFNFYCDPKAINLVLGAGLNPLLVTWDICTRFEVDFSYIQTLESETPGGKFVIELMHTFMRNFGLKNKTHFELCDPLTVMGYMGYGQTTTDEVCIITDHEQFGKSYSEHGCPPVKYFYASKAEVRDIIEAMMEKLTIRKKPV
jgi:inosine-uridine nucleoside N-ribohydrolase